MTAFFLIGTLLGLSAGLSPGPLLTLLVTETLRHNSKAGINVAISPIITDLPIILLTVFILGQLSGFHSLSFLVQYRRTNYYQIVEARDLGAWNVYPEFLSFSHWIKSVTGPLGR